MSAHAFEEQVGEEGNRCGVDYLQPFHPFRFIFSCAQPAVRRNVYFYPWLNVFFVEYKLTIKG